MLFNSFIFIFCFLPLTLGAYFFIGNFAGCRAAFALIVLSSIVFYAWWSPSFLLILAPSVVANALIGRWLIEGSGSPHSRRLVFLFGICANVALLGYFKYANFFIDNINSAFSTSYNIGNVILPLGISFFTFQKIAFLVDAYRGEVKQFNFLNYVFFVSFFPQLIAGPIVHHKEIIPQLALPNIARPQALNIAIGFSIFSIGLFKKAVLADSIGTFADPVFAAAAAGHTVSFVDGWLAALAYTFQLYFDFSGYSDMAIGLARMFNIVLPLNFHSPYKAASVIDFWQRWHITLSRFLRDYIYIPLGGNRRTNFRRYCNLLATMLIGGLWHGAGWNFILWGALHGVFLAINHAWRTLRGKLDLPLGGGGALGYLVSWALTFFSVVNAWVLFRAPSMQSATSIFKAMYVVDKATIVNSIFDYFRVQHLLLTSSNFIDSSFLWLLAAALVGFAAPDVYDLFRPHSPALVERDFPMSRRRPLYWTLSLSWAIVIALLFFSAVLQLGKLSPFLYYQF
jgi:alginate O-acetyltransferase complex protein AlgI